MTPALSALMLFVAYALGAVSGSLVLGRARGVDIRQQGSGNAGGTNALRALGWRFALGVVAIDVGKGVAATLLPMAMGGGPALPLWCGLAAIAGHIWPVWHGFRGGKGGATSVGVLACVMPLALVTVAAVWLVTLGLSGYVGLATMLAALSVIAHAALFGPSVAWWAHVMFAAGLAALVLFAHRANIRRLARGDELRFDKARLLWPARDR